MDFTIEKSRSMRLTVMCFEVHDVNDFHAYDESKTVILHGLCLTAVSRGVTEMHECLRSHGNIPHLTLYKRRSVRKLLAGEICGMVEAQGKTTPTAPAYFGYVLCKDDSS